MPCYDGRGSQDKTVYRSGISPSDMQKVLDKNEWLEAALCAVFNELQKREVVASVIAEASRNGLIGIMDFWQHHQKSDEARIAKALHSFSKDEQAVIKRLLNN